MASAPLQSHFLYTSVQCARYDHRLSRHVNIGFGGHTQVHRRPQGNFERCCQPCGDCHCQTQCFQRQKAGIPLRCFYLHSDTQDRPATIPLETFYYVPFFSPSSIHPIVCPTMHLNSNLRSTQTRAKLHPHHRRSLQCVSQRPAEPCSLVAVKEAVPIAQNVQKNSKECLRTT